MPATQQLRLLLWKDYLTRKRKLITLAGVVWATAVMLSIYIVRANVDNVDYSTCQYPARALPSAGMLPFLQSFICSVNNDCENLDKFDEIPTYENSKLTQLQRQFAPLLYNETVLDVAGSVPDALKLLSKLADIVDEPTFVGISKNGLRVRELFTNPVRVRRYLSSRLDLNDDVANSVMMSELSFQGIFKGSVDRCDASSISDTLIMNNTEHLNALVAKLCSLSDNDVQKLFAEVTMEIDFNKFIKMIGNMYWKLTGDDRVSALGDTVTAVLRMTRLTNFLPKEVVAIVSGNADFSYFDLELVQKFVELFKPTFGDTESYKSIQDFADTIVVGVKYLNKFLVKNSNNDTDLAVRASDNGKGAGLKNITKAFDNAVEVFHQAMSSDDSIDVFNVLSQVTKFIHKWLSDDLKHDILLYSTLLTKLIDGANKVISINMNIEERTYNVSLRHPEGVKILVGLPSTIVAKGFEALADAERTQVMTAKISTPGQMFCDLNRLQGFFKISKDDASSLRSKLCTDAWKNFVTDLIRSFGIYDVKENINAMASILIQETLGKDVSDQLYTIDYDFQVLKNFTSSLTRITSRDYPEVNWMKLFNVTENSDFMKTLRSKGHLGKQMLIVTHGALAKEVVRQNPILSYKITPGLIDTTTLVTALNGQLDSTSADLVKRVRELYPQILETIVRTALDEEKTYKSLSTHSENIMCYGSDVAGYFIELPQNVNQEELVITLCNISRAIEGGLTKDSLFGKALENIRASNHKIFAEVQWTSLINGLKNLYVKLERDYPYLFEYKTYGLSEVKQVEVNKIVEDAKRFWFGGDSLGRSLHLGLKFSFRLLDLLDREAFNVTSEGWRTIKYVLFTLSGPLNVVDDFVKTVSAIYRNDRHESSLPPTTVAALERLIPNLPQLLVDTTEIIVKGDTQLRPIIAAMNAEPPWPCSTTSLAELLPLSTGSTVAVQALETIWCMDHNFTDEWTDYLKGKHVTMFDLKNWNTTTYPPHVFLQFSSALDGLIEDGHLVKTIADDLSSEETKPGDVTWATAWNSIVYVLEREDRDLVLKKFFSKLDTVLSSINTTSPGPVSLHALWSTYLSCGNGQPLQGNCSHIARAAWKKSLQFFAVMFSHVAGDLLEYFTEINEPNANLLQFLGFTRNTTLHELYDKLPDFMGVLLHSYWDFGFMGQIRRASQYQFWDCEAVLKALVAPPGSRVDAAAIHRIQPYVCPSIFYWLSLPRGDNKFLDVVAKPQYYFFTIPADNLTSNFEIAYDTAIKLTNLLKDIANKNQTLLTEEDIRLNSLQHKLEQLVDSIINYKINETDTSYKLFYDINHKYFTSSIYLTRIVTMISRIATAIEELKTEDINVPEDDKKKMEADLVTIQKTFKRRPADIVALHFDVLTDVLWTNNDNYTLVDALEAACRDLKNNDTKKVILVDIKRIKNQICSKMYKELYKSVEKVTVDDQQDARDSLVNLVKVLQDGDNGVVVDIFEFFNQRNQLVTSLRRSIQPSYELGIPLYLKYLQSNLRHYDVITKFLAGGAWWEELRALYDGPNAKEFLDSMEISFEIVEDVLTGLDRIHLVRLLRDINVNNTDVFCLPNITLSDYLPDGTGRLSSLKQDMCSEDNSQLFRELPPLLFASQGYDPTLKLPKDINYTSLLLDIAVTQVNLDQISVGPKSPQRPPWATEDKLKHLRTVATGLLSKKSLIRTSFGLLTNLADAGTLFLNNSQCTACSHLTSWLKQLNLQVFKKQEYDSLLCRLHDMSLSEVHRTLQNDFHWDMAIRELILTRNYTKYELNKSLNDLLEQVKLHLLDDMLADSTKLTECLAQNVTRNSFGNVTLMLSVLSHTARLLRAQTPHLHEIEGVTTLPYFKKLSEQIARNLDIRASLKKYLIGETELKKLVGDEVGEEIIGAEVNLKLVQQNATLQQLLKLPKRSWEDVCGNNDCDNIKDVVYDHINTTLIDKDLETLQNQEFWRFTFVSKILLHIEQLVSHAGRLVGVFSRVDVGGVMEGKLLALLDLMVQVLREDVTDDIVYSLQGMVTELHPLLDNTSLEFDLKALSGGLTVIRQFKNYLLEKEDLKLSLGSLISRPERLERSLEALGINNTNFWSLSAPRLHAGHIDLKPILTSNPSSISAFVCQMDPMSSVLLPADLDVVTADDVYAAVVEQFCGLPDDTVKDIVGAVVGNLNFTLIMDKVASTLLPLLYSAANLTESQGAAVLQRYPQMAALLPTIQNSVGDLGDTIAKEPLVQSLRGAGSVGGLLGSPEFLQNAGKMLCGRAFQTDTNRFYKAIAESKDYADQPDQAQLDVLPTDFCRDLYKDIVNMDGGKIVWTFVKPLIMGKILYTPATPTVQRIIEQANSSFAHMIKLTSLVHSFAASFPSLDQLSTHREGISALRRIISSPSFSDLKTMLIGDGDVPNVDIDGLFDFGDLQGIGSILKKGSDLLRCINLDRFRAVPDEFQLTHEAVKLSRVNEFSAGLVFMGNKKNDDFKHVEYKIRMDIENTPTTARMKNYLWIPGPEASFIENMRYFRGFIQIQDLVDRAIIQLSRSDVTRRKRDVEENKFAVYTQQEPYPCYKRDFFQTSLYESQALMVAFFFSLLFTVASTVRFIVADKESGNTMLMSVMGVDLTNHTLSWFITSLCEMVVTVICMTIVLYAGGILPHTDPSLVFALLMVFGLSVLAFCYMMSKLFKSASVAAVCSAIAYLVTFMPFVLILSLEAVLSTTLKLIVCLSMSSSICYAFLNITRAEARGGGAQWGDLSRSADDDLSIAASATMALLDAAVYLGVGYLIDRFFGPKTASSSITHSSQSGEKAGVSVVNVTKIYGAGTRRQKVALDNVSIELHKGQVTTLLGHNGAGKTTLIKILTGMSKPTRGHVIVREASSETRAGVCPQRDVLFESLTAAEHVALYAQLKSGQPLPLLRDEVDNILQVLSLGPVAHEPVSRLSGGTRRRVCVALAFVARPHLVSLDEPTAGVDPAARREIWSMIVKLREERTILLTTHHLDEAELLSDQIVIMHKGQVHTTGSPIEIKRSLGNGYKLSVSYTKSTEPWPEEEASIEEKTKHLMAVVRDVVKNAILVDVTGLEVEITLPFFDADGVNNDFLELCTTLEKRQSELGFKNYALDCSSLEQVFFNITQQADTSNQHEIQYDPESPSKSASTSSVRGDHTPLVPADGPLRASGWQQYLALLHARYIHYTRNRWLLFLLIVLPSLFVATAMAFSTIRPPPDNEVALSLSPALYSPTTDYLVPHPSGYSNIDPSFAERVLGYLKQDKQSRNWTLDDTPNCTCTDTKQVCEERASVNGPQMILVPDVNTLNQWIVSSHDEYIEKRYGGFTSALKNNMTYLIAWYNNKGHHAMPAYLNALNSAILKTVTGDDTANITVYSHPLKISEEQLSKDTVYQHIADAGISGLVLLAYCLVSGGAAIYLVSLRVSVQKRLQLLCGVSPARYIAAALTGDMLVIVINMVITVIVFEAFGFPVFVARSNLPAICLLIFLYGYACSSLVHVAEKMFTEPSLANMVLFCGNAFLGLAGITLLLILDIISDSQETDDARWVLHKVLLLCPQFVLGDGMLEIAKNTIQAQVLNRFGMDTYKDPLTTNLIVYHYIALVAVGTALLLLNLAIEYDYFESLFARFRSESIPEKRSGEMEDLEVAAERKRVHIAVNETERPVRLPTIGNINAGFVDTEVKNNSIKRYVSGARDVAACIELGKAYPALRGRRIAVRALTLGIPAGQCTALLGQNGAGKSTTFAMLTGELRPTSGQVYLQEQPVSPRQLCQGLISYCPQSDAIDPLLTVRETLQFYCKLRGIDEQDEVIKRALEMFDLSKYADVRNGTLSGGNKRKLCTAIAFMGRTPLVLLDEPTSGMDPGSRVCAWRGISVARYGGRGVLVSTHALEDARRLCARVALMRAGELCALAPLDDCLKRFGGGYVVWCRVRRSEDNTGVSGGSAAAAWRTLRAAAPHARLRVLHQAALHFLIPTLATVDKKEVTTTLSDIFLLMARLQNTCDIEDFTVNQSSLDQMFLTFTEKGEEEEDPTDLEPLALPQTRTADGDDLSRITSL